MYKYKYVVLEIYTYKYILKVLYLIILSSFSTAYRILANFKISKTGFISLRYKLTNIFRYIFSMWAVYTTKCLRHRTIRFGISRLQSKGLFKILARRLYSGVKIKFTDAILPRHQMTKWIFSNEMPEQYLVYPGSMRVLIIRFYRNLRRNGEVYQSRDELAGLGRNIWVWKTLCQTSGLEG